MRFSASDGVVTVLTVVFAGFLLNAFWSDLEAITSRGDEPPLGTVTFKKQTATRRSAHSQVWERLQNQSPVYESDTLRTADGSEAVIHFDDGLALELQENTMLRLTLQGQVKTVDFTEGSVTLQGGGTGALALGQSGRTLTLSDDAQLVLTKTADTMSLELAQGTASVTDAQGAAQDLSPLQALDLDTKSGTTKVRPVDLVPRSPGPGARLVDLGSTLSPVELVYQIGPGGPDSPTVEVEVSERSDFSTSLRAQGTPEPGSPSVYRAGVPLTPGTWYWRVSAPGGHSATRSFTLFQEPPLGLVSPSAAEVLPFRKKAPSVAFSWSASELVSSWVFEVSRSSDFLKPEIRRKTNLTRISEVLAEGEWYWRVTPVWTAQVTPWSPEVRRLQVVRRPAMAPLVPEVPVEGTVVQTQELTSKGLAFTWSPVAEAQGYELSVRRGPDAGSPALATFASTTPYLLLTPDQLRPLAGEGQSVWTLRWRDDEGNLSPPGAPRTLRTVDGTMALRPTYPPDGYWIGEPFITNTRFGWKSNLALKTTFQVSRQRDFGELVYEAPAEDGTRLGRNWGLGTFYWRLSSLNANGSVFLQTEPRRFEVLGPLPPARLDDPAPGAEVWLPEDHDREVSWTAVPGADYYRVGVYAGASAEGPLVLQTEVESSVKKAPGLKLPLSRLSEGEFTVRIQAFHRESEVSTSLIGLYGESRFTYHRLFLPRPESPVAVSLDGLKALREGVTFAWTTPTPAPKTEVIVRRQGTVVARLDAQGSAHWARVPAGDYTWEVTGTVDDFELAATASFSVAPVVPLPAPEGMSPDQAVWGPSQLRGGTTFDLSWQPVAGAEGYHVRLYRDEEVQPIYQGTVRTNHVSLPKATTLSRGRFHWSVEARVWGPNGTVDQPGVPGRTWFVVDIPVLQAPQLPEDRTLYGR